MSPERPHTDGLPEGYMEITSALSARVFRADGKVEDLGVIARKEVTNQFVTHLVDVLQATDSTFSDYKYHASGTGTGAETTSDVCTTFTSPDAPVTGTQTEGGTPTIYRSVATVNYTGTKAVTEHGVSNNATWNAGNLLDRSVFGVINVGNGDSIEFTYDLTVNAGG